MNDVDPEIRRFLVEKLESFERLELLVLAWRHRQPWTSMTASAEIQIPEPLVEVALRDLRDMGLFSRGRGGYQYEPRSEQLRDVAEKLCNLYETDRLLVLNVLTRAAFDRIRSSAATMFADAFKFRKTGRDDPEGGDRG